MTIQWSPKVTQSDQEWTLTTQLGFQCVWDCGKQRMGQTKMERRERMGKHLRYANDILGLKWNRAQIFKKGREITQKFNHNEVLDHLKQWTSSTKTTRNWTLWIDTHEVNELVRPELVPPSTPLSSHRIGKMVPSGFTFSFGRASPSLVDVLKVEWPTLTESGHTWPVTPHWWQGLGSKVPTSVHLKRLQG